jgi:hypothetical protein
MSDGEQHVDSERFDRWTRSLTRQQTRRGLLGVIAGGALALLARRPGAAQIAGPGMMCGGIAGLPCPDGFECVDSPSDGCDPEAGGADCGGVCVPIFDQNPCAAILCIEGTTCCPNCGGICIPADVPCSDELCIGEPCNQTVCGPGEYCCNESCSRCVALGEGCTREFCSPEPPAGEPCGTTTCGPGEYCCNESCSICAPLGGACIDMFCEPDQGGVPCGPTVCAPGQVCCNESCGICTPPDGVCIALYCGA